MLSNAFQAERKRVLKVLNRKHSCALNERTRIGFKGKTIQVSDPDDQISRTRFSINIALRVT